MVGIVLYVEEAASHHFIEEPASVLIALVELEKSDLGPGDAFAHQFSIALVLQA